MDRHSGSSVECLEWCTTVRDISRSKLTHMLLTPNDDNGNHDSSRMWKKPLQGTMKINCDDSYLASVAFSTCGVELQNDKGDFLKAFSRRLVHLYYYGA